MERAVEQALIRRAAAGDRAAAGECVRAFQGQLYAYILRLSGRPEVAEDIVQEAFVRALTNLDRFDDRYRFSTWLFTIARRLYINSRQKLKPMYESELVGSIGGDGARPDSGTIDDEVAGNARDEIQRALLHLPPDQREVVVLFHQFDWSIAQIAGHMGMPEGTVKSHLHRGRRRLRAVLESSERSANRVEEVWG